MNVPRLFYEPLLLHAVGVSVCFASQDGRLLRILIRLWY